MATTTAALRDLHRIHRQLSDLRERIARGPRQIKAREANVARLDEEVAAARGQSKAGRMAADQKQLMLKTGENKIEELRRKLNACSTNREYQALLEQIAADEMANSVLADEILESLEKVDEHQRVIVEAEKRGATAREELSKTRQAVDAQQALLEADVRRLEAELKEAEVTLPPDVRDAYDRGVKSKGSDAMAAVENNSCGGCFSQLTPNTHNALAMSRIVFCQSCGRLLYLPEDRSLASSGA